LVRVTLAKPRHEFVERVWVTTVTVARLWHSWRKPALQRFNCPASNFILHLERVFHVEVTLFRKGCLLGFAIEELNGNAPVCSQLLHIPLQDVAHPQIATCVRRVASSSVVENC